LSNITIDHKLTLSPNEAINGTKKLLTRKGKRLEITIPAGVKTGTLVRLSGALQITDGYYGDIVIQIKVKSRRRGVLAVTTIAGLFIIIICFVVIGYFVPNSGGTTESTVSPPNASSNFITVFYDEQLLFIFGKPMQLVNNNDATNPTWQQLEDFLRSDKTDQNQYIPDSYMCADFARDVHNNAEAAGIRAAFVGVFFYGEIEDHALNAFETIDKGLVYIDCTGPTHEQWLNQPSLEWDTIVYIEKGKEYQPIFLYEPDYITFEPLGIVEAVEIYWR